jgi:hypothetical protein
MLYYTLTNFDSEAIKQEYVSIPYGNVDSTFGNYFSKAYYINLSDIEKLF